MKLPPRFLLCTLVLGLALTPALSLAAYQSAEDALGNLETFLVLTPDQEKKALQIFQTLKDVMDTMTPEERPVKGMQYRQDARAAIRAILTPEQQAIYDRTPQRMGGGMTSPDPAMSALRGKISAFARNLARSSPEIAAQVGTVEKVVVLTGGSSMRSAPGAEYYDDPMLHPDSGTTAVRVSGSLGTKIFVVCWKMDESGVISLTKIEKGPKPPPEGTPAERPGAAPNPSSGAP